MIYIRSSSLELKLKMCGICGFSKSDEKLIREMLDALKHRGPDDVGYLVDNYVSIGNTRLSIIDLSEAARQPIFNEDKTVAVVFNGEIYNYIELREELMSKGHVFKTNSDTEVIVHAYEEWGFNCVEKFNGMWAFAIYDTKRKIIFLSRDRFGIKPLYYHYDEKTRNLYFASEVKAILKALQNKPTINLKGIIQYLLYRDTIDNTTVYNEIQKLLPAHNLIFNLKNRELSIRKYWDIPDQLIEEISEEEALKELEDRLKKSIKFRIRSDVPIGAILSGGLDSSIVTSLMRVAYNEEKNDGEDEFYTFTVRFRSEKLDEGVYARMVAKKYKTKHVEVYLDDEDFIKTMIEYANIKDTPIGVPNEIALYQLAKKIRDHGVKVVLSGEGSDEIFYGYSRIFRSPFDFERIRILSYTPDGKKLYKTEFKSLHKIYKGQFFERMLDLFLFRYNYFTREDVIELFGKDIKQILDEIISVFEEKWYKIRGDNYRRISYVFLKIHLPILLNRVDNAMMAASVESRVPFLDPDVVSFVFNLPNELKSRWKSTGDYLEAIKKSADEIAEVHDEPKYILKKLGEKYLPKEIIKRKKQGFPVPFKEWLSDIVKVAEKILLKENSNLDRFLGIHSNRIRKWMNKKIQDGDKLIGQKIWMLLALEFWLNKWVKGEHLDRNKLPS